MGNAGTVWQVLNSETVQCVCAAAAGCIPAFVYLCSVGGLGTAKVATVSAVVLLSINNTMDQRGLPNS